MQQGGKPHLHPAVAKIAAGAAAAAAMAGAVAAAAAGTSSGVPAGKSRGKGAGKAPVPKSCAAHMQASLVELAKRGTYLADL